MRRNHFQSITVGSLVFSATVLAAIAAAGSAPVPMASGADRQILQSYLKHCEGAVARLTPEAVQKITEGERICWVWSRYVEMPLVAYRLTRDKKYIEDFVKAMDVLGTRFKHTLRLEGDRYSWHYWDPAGDWDRKIDDPTAWKHWIGPEHRGGYHNLTVAMAAALYDHGVVFDKTDIERFLNTQMQVCWNGSFDQPVFKKTDGRAAGGEQRFLAPALARFEPKISKFLYEHPGTEERLAKRSHSWQGGPGAMGYLRGKYLSPRSPEPTRTKYRAQFCKPPENARFLDETEFQITPGGAGGG